MKTTKSFYQKEGKNKEKKSYILSKNKTKQNKIQKV